MDKHLRNILLNAQVHGTPYDGGYGTKIGAAKAIATRRKIKKAKTKKEKEYIRMRAKEEAKKNADNKRTEMKKKRAQRRKKINESKAKIRENLKKKKKPVPKGLKKWIDFVAMYRKKYGNDPLSIIAEEYHKSKK